MKHDLNLENELFKMYEQINIGNAETCMDCRKDRPNLSRPISFWFVGEKYAQSKYKTLFIGKTARGNPGKPKGSYMDTRNRAEELWEVSWAYWSYARSISDTLYGNNSGDYIAYTNVIKCNQSNTRDTTPKLIKNNCILRMHIIKKEIDLLKPKNIVFFTSWGYDDYFYHIFDEIQSKKSQNIDIGKIKMPWWEFTGTINNNQINVLRIGHPERKKKVPYVTKVSDWVIHQVTKPGPLKQKPTENKSFTMPNNEYGEQNK